MQTLKITHCLANGPGTSCCVKRTWQAECPYRAVVGGLWGRQVFILKTVHVSYYHWEEGKLKKRLNSFPLTLLWPSVGYPEHNFLSNMVFIILNKLLENNTFLCNWDWLFFRSLCNHGTLFLKLWKKLSTPWNQRILSLLYYTLNLINSLPSCLTKCLNL